MILIIRLITRLYATLVRLYPQSFRVEFEDEMRQVFADVVVDVETLHVASLRRGLLLAVVCLREVKGFPRWSFPYWGMALAFSSLLVGAALPGLIVFGHTFGRGELWGWRAWIPVLTVAVIALLLTRVVRPLRQLVTGVWHDWTRLSFAFYGTCPRR